MASKGKGVRRRRPTRAPQPRRAKDPLQLLLRDQPDLEMIEVLFTDVNGILRGKRVGPDDFAKVFDPGISLPGATALLDCKGMTCDSITNGTADGDPDMICRPVDGTSVPVPWAARPTAQTLVSMYHPDGTTYFADPRHVLEQALAPLTAMGLTPVVAIELEFYVLEGDGGAQPRAKLGRVPGTSIEQDGPQYNSLDDLLDLEPFFADVADACRSQAIPASAALAEFSPGQYEINLHHVADPMRACEHALMLKRLVKGVARRHGMGASFMAKPFADAAGCGLHVHVSLLDRDGRNLFTGRPGSSGEPPIAASLRHAIGGLAATMAESMAIFAPNANSYRRLRPASFVPLAPNWGINHRRLALRIPLSDADNLRVEHRVAGADANPYLVVAAVLAGIHHGLRHRIDPGPMVGVGEVFDEVVTLPTRWDRALDLFDASKVLQGYLGQDFCRIYSQVRREECDRFHSEVGRKDYEWYLRNV
jgi:glutamine synthetase